MTNKNNKKAVPKGMVRDAPNSRADVAKATTAPAKKARGQQRSRPRPARPVTVDTASSPAPTLGMTWPTTPLQARSRPATNAEVSGSTPPRTQPKDPAVAQGVVDVQAGAAGSRSPFWRNRKVAFAAFALFVMTVTNVVLWAVVFHRYSSVESVGPPARSRAHNGASLSNGANASSSVVPSAGISTAPPREPLTPGITARSTISSSGSLRTDTHVEFRRSVSALTFSVPATGATWANAGFDPRITHLQVVVDGRHVSDMSHGPVFGRAVTVYLPADTSAVDVTYEATGVISQGQHSTPGRALVLATPLRMSAPSALSTTIVLQGDQILNLGCWPPDSTPEACGEHIGDEWRVHTRAGAGAVEVAAQMNLRV